MINAHNNSVASTIYNVNTNSAVGNSNAKDNNHNHANSSMVGYNSNITINDSRLNNYSTTGINDANHGSG